MNGTVPRNELPSALAQLDGVFAELRGRTPAVFLDYDGVLTPIVATPDLAVLAEPMKDTIERLAVSVSVAVISGRDLDDVRAMVRVDGVYYAGSHGFDIEGPGGIPLGARLADRFAPFLGPLTSASDELEDATRNVPGTFVERKRYTTAVHFRSAARTDVPRVERSVASIAARHPELRVTTGKEILEFRPDLDWDKGTALLWLMERMQLDRERVGPVYLGDDVTDEDAFRAIREMGVGIVVGLDGPPTLARYALGDPNEVRTFLDELRSVAR